MYNTISSCLRATYCSLAISRLTDAGRMSFVNKINVDTLMISKRRHFKALFTPCFAIIRIALRALKYIKKLPHKLPSQTKVNTITNINTAMLLLIG
jgi:hypothetical protein